MATSNDWKSVIYTLAYVLICMFIVIGVVNVLINSYAGNSLTSRNIIFLISSVLISILVAVFSAEKWWKVLLCMWLYSSAYVAVTFFLIVLSLIFDYLMNTAGGIDFRFSLFSLGLSVLVYLAAIKGLKSKLLS
mgnify:FL=1